MKKQVLIGMLLSLSSMNLEASPLEKHCIKAGENLKCSHDHLIDGMAESTMGLLKAIHIKGETTTNFNELMSGLKDNSIEVPVIELSAVIEANGPAADIKLYVKPIIYISTDSSGEITYKSYDLRLRGIKSKTLPKWILQKIKLAVETHPEFKNLLDEQAESLVVQINDYFHGGS